ncbi:MAG: Ig-like domain-containing protein, partial [Candidatus Eremiobacterota bacterium]
MAPQVSVTFNQPMVAVTSHEELAKLPTPVKLTPQPPGNWRWVGTKTLLFDPRGEVSEDSTQQARFPMATEYQVEVPAGTQSASGQALAAAVNWSFKTPTVQVVSSHPSDGSPQPLEPLMYVTLNQDVDAAAVLATLKLSSGGQEVSLRMATAQEVPAYLKSQQAKRWVAFKATRPLVPATTYTVTMGPGTPSAEGPLKTTAPQTFNFRTYDKFRVEESRCGWGNDCPPLTPFWIRFNNPVDTKKYAPSMVRVEPELPRMKVDVAGNGMTIRGESKGRTTYTVTLSANLPDEFGQTLEKEEKLTFKVGSAEPTLLQIGGQLVALDPYGPPSYSVYCINHQSLKVKVTAVKPEDWKTFCERLARETHKDPFVPPGQPIFNGNLATGARPDELTEVRVDLGKALSDGKGMAVVVIEPARQPREDWRRQRVVAWVQATQLGIDAAVDSQNMLGWVTSLQDGKPVAGATLTLLDTENHRVSEATTGADGLANLPLGATAPLLVARSGDDTAILPQYASYYNYQSGWYRVGESDSLRWFVVDDRKMYRPSEKVQVKGFLRRFGAGPKGDIVALKGEVSQMSYRVVDSQGNEILKGETKVSPEGGFDLVLTLPKTPN